MQILDHGYLKLVETWGSDERIVEAARMSTGKGFLGWGAAEKPGDEKLLRYLSEHHHDTPFEMAGLVIEVQAPILVFREWHRHRTQCLGPDTLVHFEAPKSAKDRRFVYKMRIEDIWKKWQPTVRADRPQRQTNPFFPRSRLQGMLLRCLDEENKEIIHTSILDVIKGEPKPMIKVATASGRSLVATREHRVLTSAGWATLGEALSSRALLTLEGVSRGNTMRWEVARPDYQEQWLPIVGWREYEVSNHGQVRRVGCEPKRMTVGASNYNVVSLNRPGEQVTRTVHSLVAEAFIGLVPGSHVRHKNNNRADNTLCNLLVGSPRDNVQDMFDSDRFCRLVPVFEDVVSVVELGELPTYDLSVQGPWHNFIADGFVVHNSYNEMSARYTPLPDVNYVPTVERCLMVQPGNKQAGSIAEGLTHEKVLEWLEKLQTSYAFAELVYQEGLAIGIPKELARCPVPVARYSRMRASANLRNWLAFLTLRSDCMPSGKFAQWEIRQYANTVGELIREAFPRTFELFCERGSK